MPSYIALLRAVNVGGTGKLPMSDLQAMCAELRFDKVRTYIASGNVVFQSDLPEKQVQAKLAARLEKYAKRPVGVLVRTAEEMSLVLKANPFQDRPPNRTVAIFLNGAPPVDLLSTLRGQKDEIVQAGKREIYVFYGEGMGTSKLKIPAAETGTARNMNTVARLAEMGRAMQ